MYKQDLFWANIPVPRRKTKATNLGFLSSMNEPGKLFFNNNNDNSDIKCGYKLGYIKNNNIYINDNSFNNNILFNILICSILLLCNCTRFRS